MSVSCKCCLLSRIDICDRPILRTEESYREKESVNVKTCLCVCVCVCVCVCFIECHQMQQTPSKRVGRRGHTKKERKKAKCFCCSAEQAGTSDDASNFVLMPWLFRIMNAIPNYQPIVLHSASESLVENAEIIRILKLMCSKNI